MTVSPTRLLAFVVDRYDEQGCPLTATDAATDLDVPPATVAARFERLADCDLLSAVEGGYRPTVTARELLALDCDGDVVVVDPDP
ncbi:hypothetical protein [Halorientalis litorea]|uniref:hypothetical protein n=1 Tax=Halorientalis litorea TaxID=2931977 RepID=UPI001FF4C306|nr:hypothetical protein [Halorientalis litorea]